ncbi:MAG: TIGR04282 family arsenosugar biosynthesis glycosyltransferase [Acidiferrobacterales bacterium]
MKRPDLILFAKQPRVGEAKTRLAQVCGPQRAAVIAADLIRQTVALAADSWPGEVYLCGAPDARHPLFAQLAAELHLHLAVQGEGSLGERMLRSLRLGIERAGAAAVMGCDVPHCSAVILEDAYETLARGGNVIGPALDGGYYFIGLQRADPALFAGLEWGGNRVLDDTQVRARAARVEFHVLPALRDIDTWEDLVCAARRCPALQSLISEE